VPGPGFYRAKSEFGMYNTYDFLPVSFTSEQSLSPVRSQAILEQKRPQSGYGNYTSATTTIPLSKKISRRASDMT